MENKKENEGFSYTYSAKQQEEINKIRNKYIAPEEDKMEQLRHLDEGVTKKASISSLIVGIIGALILGFGMSLFMSDLSVILGISNQAGIIIGVITGILGIALVALACPLYNKIIKAERKKIAPEIIRLTDELMK